MSHELERIKGIERQRELLIKSINAIREKLALEDDPIRTIRYKDQLAEREGELRKTEQEVQQMYSVHSYTGQALLAQQIAELGITRSMGSLHLVNCDRKSPKDRFWDLYDRMAEHRFQFYILTSCETQKPGSFAERMLYEYLTEELDDATDALYYEPDPSFADLRRPLMADLPKGRNLEKCQHAFRKHFSTFWKLGEQQSMEEYLRHGLPRNGYDAVAMLFHIHAEDWNSEVTLPYLEWIVDTLQTAHREVPRVLFFLKVNFNGAHLMPEALEENPAFQDIKTVLTQHPGVAHLLPFGPVNKADVERWFSDLRPRHTALLDQLLDVFQGGLNKGDQQLFRHQHQLNMDDMELLQWEVYTALKSLKI